MPHITDHSESEDVFILCPLWDLAGSCVVQARADGGPCQDHGNSQFEGPKECQIAVRNFGPYWVV